MSFACARFWYCRTGSDVTITDNRGNSRIGLVLEAMETLVRAPPKFNVRFQQVRLLPAWGGIGSGSTFNCVLLFD
jgi:hypothetical protein